MATEDRRGRPGEGGEDMDQEPDQPRLDRDWLEQDRLDLDRGVDPERPYRARQLAPYRRDAGLYDSGLKGRYPGLRGSGARDPRIRSTGPGLGRGAEESPERAAMLAGRIAIVATIVIGQLWALTVALNAWQEQRMGQVWLLLAFQALSFALAILVWLAAPRDR